MNWGERAGRIMLLGMTLALAWIGQGLLLAKPPRLLDGLLILGIAAAAFVSLSIGRQEDGRAENSPAWVRQWLTLIEHNRRGALLLLGGISCGMAAFSLNDYPVMRPLPILFLWLASMGLLLAGARSLDRRIVLAGAANSATLQETISSQEHATTRAEAPIVRWELAALLSLMFVALIVRVMQLDVVPHNFGGDEGEMGMAARAVLRGDLRDPFTTGWLSHPTLWFFLQALALWIFGDTVFGLRLLTALLGVATIPALYALARLLYGRVIALGAAALLAVYHFHIHFSRLGVNNIVDPLLALVAFTTFRRGYQTRSKLDFALTGVTLGVAQHFYMGARLTPLVLLAVLLHQLLLDRRRLLSLRWHLALLGVGFVLGFGPLLRFFLLHPNDFNARLSIVGVFQSGWFAEQLASGISLWQILAEQLRGAFGAFTFAPDRSAFYDPRMPLLDQGSSVLFILGVAIAISQWRRIESALLLAWLLGTVFFGGVLLIGPPLSPRYITAAPALCLLIALALDRLRAALPLARRYAYAINAIVILSLAAWNLNFYFREYTPRATYGWLNTEIATEVGYYLHSQPNNIYIYFFGPPRMFIGNGAIRFLAPESSTSDVLKPIKTVDDLPTPPAGYRPLFIFLPERANELDIIKARYPGGTTRQLTARSEPVLLFITYEIASD